MLSNWLTVLFMLSIIVCIIVGIINPEERLNLTKFVEALEAGAKGILFGDLGYYWVADRQGRTFKRLNELYAPTGQVGFLSSERVDGKLILPEAVKCLQMKAAT